ncbi:hypothetical protein J1605_001431 [Eschrichtius robustus]|uniref:Uncharacterized protein n=1 Tax=Eschrichtius robustus TaxID=9764 RepID=A0AB34I5J3_ESCRO|nr:hypothetical protein J1605_001431 [Eschrichtius robustus]
MPGLPAQVPAGGLHQPPRGCGEGRAEGAAGITRQPLARRTPLREPPTCAEQGPPSSPPAPSRARRSPTPMELVRPRLERPTPPLPRRPRPLMRLQSAALRATGAVAVAVAVAKAPIWAAARARRSRRRAPVLAAKPWPRRPRHGPGARGQAASRGAPTCTGFAMKTLIAAYSGVLRDCELYLPGAGDPDFLVFDLGFVIQEDFQ